MTHVEVRGLTKVFSSNGHRLVALEDMGLEISAGEFVSVIGPSGCGKSTLLKLIGSLLEPTAGEVLIDGRRPQEVQARKEVGFVFQDPSLLPWRSVFGNVRLPLEVNRGQTRNGSSPEELLRLVGLEAFHSYYPHQLSGGMQQRVALARALVFNPALLLMDEPLGSLDEITRSEMRYELLRIWEHFRSTVIFVTHSIPEAVLLADRVVVMTRSPGKIKAVLDLRLGRPRDEAVERSEGFRDYVAMLKSLLR